MSTIYPGYMGIATVNGNLVRCTDFSVNIKQEPVFYDHTIGLRDTIPDSIYDGKRDGGDGTINPQKIIWRPGVKLVQGSFSFPWTSSNSALQGLFDNAKNGATLSSLSFGYSCDFGRAFYGCKINSFSIKASAGEIVTSSVDFIGKNMGPGTASIGYSATEKLITWDTINVNFGNFGADLFSYFEITINNNCIPIYTSGGNSNKIDPLTPYDIRVGMQMVTGAVSFYDTEILRFLEEQNRAITVSFACSDGPSFSAQVITKPMEQNASVSPVIRTVGFVGVDKVFK